MTMLQPFRNGVVVIAMVLVSGCTTYASRRVPDVGLPSRNVGGRMLITRRDQYQILLRDVVAAGDSLTGQAVGAPELRIAIALRDVESVAVREVQVIKPLLIGLAVYVITGLIALAGYNQGG